MSRDRDEVAVAEIQRPELRKGRLHCPRCAARLLYDGEELLCLACGYEYLPSDRELAEYRGSWRRAAAVVGVAPALALGMPLGTAGVVALAAVGMVLVLTGSRGRRWLRRRW